MLVPRLWLSEEKLSQLEINPQKYGNKIQWLILLICFLLLPLKYLSAQTNDDCLACHSDNTMTMEKNGKEISIFTDEQILRNSPHKNLQCISCHTGFNPDEIPHKEEIKPINCKSCHQNAPLKHKFHPQILKSGGSNGKPEVSCKGCHGTHNIVSPDKKNSKWNKNNLIESCGNCHKVEKEKFTNSDHFKAFTKGVEGAPECIKCHESSVVSISEGRDTLQLKVAQQKLCLSCHLDDEEIRSRTVPSAGFIKAYEESVHGIAFSKGNTNAATCIDCHNSHDSKGPNDPLSSINKLNIPHTCGKCHSEIEKEFNESIHGVSVLKGNLEAPVCTDCHGEHNIFRHTDPRSPVAYKNLSREVCAPCHNSVKLTEKFGISSNRYKTFSDSYHGLALQGGSLEVANCASCHGVHNIKPSSDSTSMVSKINLIKTCGSCHPGANENFAVGKIHVTLEKEDEPILYWIASTYVVLIITVIGGMLFHNFIDFLKKAKIKKLKQRGLIREEKHGHSLYLRMTFNERIQHISLAISFILLVITGFMLRFPESWWVEHIRDLSNDAFEYRSLVHRIAAVVMVLVSLYHIYYIIATKRGRELVKDLFPVYRDLQEMIGVAKFNLGLSKIKPKLGRFSYIEKAEYWALVWGTIVMTVTGLIMWFDNTFIGLFTKLGWDIARTIHYYEAWLAFLAIVIWHFYFVIFNPDVYPMNVAWLKGNISEEEMAEEHPAELEEIRRKQFQDENIVETEFDGETNNPENNKE
jgi:cytochrome b subunit of formate dehydrogenase